MCHAPCHARSHKREALGSNPGRCVFGSFGCMTPCQRLTCSIIVSSGTRGKIIFCRKLLYNSGKKTYGAENVVFCNILRARAWRSLMLLGIRTCVHLLCRQMYLPYSHQPTRHKSRRYGNLLGVSYVLKLAGRYAHPRATALNYELPTPVT